MDDPIEELRRIFGMDAPADDADIKAFDAAVWECRAMFIDRRKQYGNHLDRPRTLEYLTDGLKLKMTRIQDDIRAGRGIKRDTLVDAVDFALMALSLKHAREAGCK